MSEEQRAEIDGDPEVVPEIRTRRLALVNDTGDEQVVVQVRQGVAEIVVGGDLSDAPCHAVIFAGEDEPGHHTAGIELWAKGNSVGGATVSVAGRETRFHRFGTDSVQQD
jgi:hypothetical protein